MRYKEILCDRIINKITQKDNLFKGKYTVDPYQNCEFSCSYCDSAIEKTLYIKTNAATLLKEELPSLTKDVVIVGSVHDPYQQAEKKYNLTKMIIETLIEFDFPIHILTKSPLILRDIDLLKKMELICVTLTVFSLNEQVNSIFEKNVSPPQTRVETVKTLNENGIYSGLAIIPILPYITDNEFDSIIKNAAENKVQYILHKHLELKGDQKTIYMNLTREYFPNYFKQYQKLYGLDVKPNEQYVDEIDNRIKYLCNKFGVSQEIKNLDV